MPELAAWQWALGALCAFQVGVAKTGLPGVGILAIPLMVITVGDARQSAGWLLPVLCIADLFAVYYWRRHAAARTLFSLAPWVLGGIATGAAALTLNERILRPMIGVIILIMLAIYLWRRYQKHPGVPGHGAPYGLAAGFASTVANAAGPVMNLYLLSRRLSKEEFVATGAWFFFFVNLTKAPIYVWHGMITPRSLVFDLVMIPAVLAGALAGRWFLMHIPARIFEIAILFLTGASTLLLFR